MNHFSISELEAIAREIRGRVIEISQKSRIPHLASSLSCIDILVAAYWNAMKIDIDNYLDDERDRFLLSKGHAAAALFATLSRRGFFPDHVLDTMGENESSLEEHPSHMCVPGVEASTGSLGHGLSLGIGMALSGRILKQQYKVFILLGDGECNEGSVWEAALFAASQKLENVMAIVDFNKWQATGRSCEVMAIEPFAEKWKAFGWSAYDVNGHDMMPLVNALQNFPDGSGKPVAILANTVKGKGVSFMEDDNNWHYRIPNQQEVDQAKRELQLI